METVKIFNYNNSSISFKMGEKTMVNATQMAKPFGKEAKFWLSNQATKDYLSELSKVRFLTLADLVIVTKGGNNPGTWMHEDVAMEFARWLSPSFAIWCNDRIKELLLTGSTTINQTTCQYDAERNILPGIHTPKSVSIAGQMIWTIQLNGEMFYKLKDIMVGAEIYDYVRKMTSKPNFKHYIFWFNDQTGTRPKRYVDENGVNILLEKTKDKYEKSKPFLISFNEFTSQKVLQPTISSEDESTPTDVKKDTVNLNGFLDIIGRVEDDKDRLFLFDLYRKLKKNDN